MVRTTVGTIAEAELAVTRSEALTKLDATQTETVTSTTTQTTTVTSSSGTFFTLTALFVRIPAPSGATSGTHRLQLSGPDGAIRYILATANFDSVITINDGIISRADTRQEPSTDAVQSDVLRSIAFDDSRSLTLEYTNDTDVDQTNDRRVDLLGIERGVTE